MFDIFAITDNLMKQVKTFKNTLRSEGKEEDIKKLKLIKKNF